MERLTAQDLSMVWPEEFGWPQDIGALAILDGSSLLEENGHLPVDHIREHIACRLHFLPRFRQLLYVPRRGLGWPLWVDAPAFDIVEHVNVLPLGTPADEERLLLKCEELRRRRLDQSRPLWQMWFLTGLPEGRIGVFMKLHHAIADGIAGVAALGALLDLAPDAPQPTSPPWTPAPFPSPSELFRDNVRRRLGGFCHAVAKLADPVDVVRQARRGWPAAKEAFAEGRAPRTSLNRPVGSARGLAVVRSSLELAKEIAQAHDGKVNDVLLATVTCGLRDLLQSRGEQVEGLALRAFVPVSLHKEPPGQAHGNLDGGMVVPLPIGEPDHVRRLRLIAEETAQRKKRSRPPGATLFRNGLIQRAFLRHAVRQRFMNVYIANVPGPPVPLYFAGAPVLELFPVVPLMGNVTLGIGALSYAGEFNITAVADQTTCPDVEVFVEGVRSSLDALGQSVLVVSS